MTSRPIPYGNHFIDNSDIKAVIASLKKKTITQGDMVEKFEKEICNYVNARYCVVVNSCTSGLIIALQALQIKKNSHVLTSAISFVSTANSIMHNNLYPVFSDIDDQTLNISINSLKKILNKKVKVLMPVHLGGLANQSKYLWQECRKKKIYIIEDAAHSFGGNYDCGSKIGSCKYSDMTVFSFHPVKTMTTGEGGAITTNSRFIYEKLKSLRNHGIIRSKQEQMSKGSWFYDVKSLGYNFRLTDFQCALGISQLKKINKILKYRKKITIFYDQQLKNNKNLGLLQKDYREQSSNHLYIIRANFKKLKKSKILLFNYMKKKGITLQTHYKPILQHTLYKKFINKKKNILNAINYYENSFSIPIFFNLKRKQQKRIVEEIKNFFYKK